MFFDSSSVCSFRQAKETHSLPVIWLLNDAPVNVHWVCADIFNVYLVYVSEMYNCWDTKLPIRTARDGQILPANSAVPTLPPCLPSPTDIHVRQALLHEKSLSTALTVFSIAL